MVASLWRLLVLLILSVWSVAIAFLPLKESSFHKNQNRHKCSQRQYIQDVPRDSRSSSFLRSAMLGKGGPPPIPERNETAATYFDHDGSVMDPYQWMRDDTRSNPRVLDQIDAENQHTERSTKHLADLRDELAGELQDAMFRSDNADDGNEDGMISNIYRQEGYLYYTQRLPDQAYPRHCRVPWTDADQYDGNVPIDWTQSQVILDENQLGNHQRIGSEQYLATHTVTTCNNRVAYSVDETGDERYSIWVRETRWLTATEAATTAMGSETRVAFNTTGAILWSNIHGTSLHYVTSPSGDSTQRPSGWYEWNGTSSQLRREETDPRYSCSLHKSSDDTMILWICENASNDSRTIWALDATSDQLNLVNPTGSKTDSEAKIWYDVDCGDGVWWMLRKQKGDSSTTRLYARPITSPSSSSWSWNEVKWMEQIDGLHDNPSLSLESLSLFRGHVVLQGRNEGLPRIWILHLNNTADTPTIQSAEMVVFDEPAHYVGLCRGQNYESPSMLISYESLIEPPRIVQVDLRSPSRQQIIYGTSVCGFQEGMYGCGRFHVPSRDGKTEIPISVCYDSKSFQDRPCPVLLQAYGAYGQSLESGFSYTRLPMLKRGIICVTAHVRGGGELGRDWYESGKRLHKTTSIHDLIDVADWLVVKGWTTPDRIACEGRSAGGLLVAAAINKRPELFRVGLLGVPFLDPLCTMADPSLPLTSLEYGEWGNPHHQIDFDNLRQISPLQNIQRKRRYPNILLIGGLYDSRVHYSEILKYAATLRDATTETDDPPLVCVKVDTAAGHSFGSDHNKYCFELSFMYAFVLDQIRASKPFSEV